MTEITVSAWTVPASILILAIPAAIALACLVAWMEGER